MNSVQLIGNITREIEIKFTQSNMAIASFGVAVNKKVKNQQGGYDDKAQFFDITAFGKTAENISKFFHKGSKIGIVGELDFSQWEDQQGQKRSKVGVICNQFDFIDKKQDGQQQQQSAYQAPQNQQQQYQQPQQQQYQPQNMQQPQQPAPIPEDSLPF